LLIDKITGKPSVSKTPAEKAAEKKALDAAILRDKNTAAAKAKADAEAKAKTDAVKPKSSPTSVVKPPVINTATGKPTGTGFGDDKEEFTTDSLGNVYKTMPDGTSSLYRAADVPEDEYTTDSLGNTYKTMPDGTSVLYRAAEVDEDIDTSTPTTGGTDDSNTPVFEPEYFEDSLGNIYISTADGEYDLYRAAEVDEDIYEETPIEEDQYYDDGEGNTYILNDSGEYELYRAAEVDEDILEEDYDLFNRDDTDYTENSDDTVAEDDDNYYDYGDDYPDIKRGGLITMMKKGGMPRFQDGGYSETDEEVQPWQNVNYNFGEEDEPTMTGYTLTGNRNPVGNTYLRNSTPVAMTNSNSQDSSYIDNGDGTYTIGNYTYDMMTDEYLYSTDPNSGNISNVSPDAIYSTNPAEDEYTTDSLGNIYKNGEFYRAAEVDEDIKSISNVGGGTKTPVVGNVLGPTGNQSSNIGSDLLNTITGALGTTAGAAGAGALIASLLGSDFGGGTGNQNQGLDMSQVGVINPRTTDFGIGPTNFVGYDDYGTGGEDYTPNEELLRNLNAPGYNPVNEGDYGYEEVAAEETEEAPKMASGGLSSMATPVASYYTFGQPADILANLGMRAQPPMNPPEMMPQIGQQQQPQQTQQQGLPQQAPPQMAQQMPQGMPQQGMMPQQQGMPPPMRKGGLPHISNVPLTQGRMDFRKGAAVHGEGDGQSDDIPAMLADGEYVIDAETVAQIGNGSTKAGAQALDKFRESIRAHKRSAPVNKIPPKTKALTSYLKGAK
jgi:hypothetical protein